VRERYGVQFRTELFNAFNHPNLTGLDNALSFTTAGVVGNGDFGHLNNDRGPREIQFGLKFTF
jgi:hypothetical protein